MEDSIPNDELLDATGYRSYDDIAASKLSSHFRPREYAMPGFGEEELRRALRQFEAGLTPASQVLSFLGAGHYEYSRDAWERQCDLTGGENVPLDNVDDLQRLYLHCAKALTGFDGISSEILTAHEAWIQVLLRVRQSRPGRSSVFVAESIAPLERRRLRAILPEFGFTYEELPCPDGVLSPASLLACLHPKAAVVLVASPNYLGCIEPMSELGQITHQAGALLGVVVDLLSLVVLRTPYDYRANFCLGNWGTFAPLPLEVGSKSWMSGVQTQWEEKLIEVPVHESSPSVLLANRMHRYSAEGVWKRFGTFWSHAHYLYEALQQIPGCKLPHAQPFFREFVVQVPGDAEELVDELEDQGIFCGLALGRDGYPRDWLLISASETHLIPDLAYFLKAFKLALARRVDSL